MINIQSAADYELVGINKNQIPNVAGRIYIIARKIRVLYGKGDYLIYYAKVIYCADGSMPRAQDYSIIALEHHRHG